MLFFQPQLSNDLRKNSPNSPIANQSTCLKALCISLLGSLNNKYIFLQPVD